MTPQRLSPHLERWLASAEPRTYVVHLDGEWTGTEQLLVGDQYVDVRVCPSELAIREELTRGRPDGRAIVLLTSADVNAADVLARIAKRQVVRLHAWDAVQHLFDVRQIDPQLVRERWMAEALVEAAPAGGYERSGARELDADRAWRALLAHRHGIDVDDGLRGLLSWASTAAGAQLHERGDAELIATTRRLEAAIDGASPVLALCAAGLGGRAVPLGLVARTLADGPTGEARAAARTLLTVTLGGWAFDESAARSWAAAAEQHVQDLLSADAPAAQTALQAADRTVRELHSETLVRASDLLAAGLRGRLADLAAALSRRRAGGDAMDGIEAAASRVRTHRLDDHRETATMVTRLVRWLAQPDAATDGFVDAAKRHAGGDSYADWARTALRQSTGEADLDAELRLLVAEADERRRAQDGGYARLLAGYVGHAAPGGAVLGVEEVLDRVVAPIAARHPVLLVVLDGMSHRVAGELTEDVVARGWVELRPTQQVGRTLVLSALPSVTTYSRASLLSGALVKGVAADESRAFAAHPGLVAVSRRGRPPVLVHKGELRDPHGGLSSQLRSELAGDRRIVAAVVNAIDDHLSRSDQLATPWTAAYVPLLRALLDESRNAGRIVILASDHGHVLDYGGTFRNGGPDHGERYRTEHEPAGAGEQLVEGIRVLFGGGRCVLAADETVRYAPRKHGYHGGASPQETLAPLLVFAPGLTDIVDGWSETPYDPPPWWTGQPSIQVAKPARPSVKANAPRREERSGQLRLGAEDVPSSPATESAPPAWIAELLAAEAFAAQRGAVSRGRVPEERVVAILAALSAAGGKLLHEALARQAGIPPLRLTGTLAVMRQLLNVDGYPVLSADEDTVTLDLVLLREQFGLNRS